MTHVHADLVGPPGFQLDPHMGMRTEAFQHPIVADGRLATVHNGHALALLAMTADGRVDGAAGDDHADDDGFIDAADTARLQLLDQTRLRLQCLGHHHQAGGVLVQPMHDTGARHVDQVGHVMQQGVEQRAIRMARCRMYHQPCGLVQYQDVFILEDDIQRNVLRHPLALRLLLGRQLEDRPCVYRIARAQHRTVDREQAILYPGAEARAGMVGEQLRRDLVETLPAQLERHLGAELDRLCIDCRHN